MGRPGPRRRFHGNTTCSYYDPTRDRGQGPFDENPAHTWREMHYGLLADLVVLVHLAFVVFVVVGGLLVFRWGWVVWLHLPSALWGALIELFGWACPLTPLEQWLRRRAGEAGYEGGFVEHYILPVLYPGELTREIQIALGVGVVALNLCVYGWLVRSRRRRSETGDAGE